MIHLLILAVHLLATIAKIVRPGGVRAVVAESLLLKYLSFPKISSGLGVASSGRIIA